MPRGAWVWILCLSSRAYGSWSVPFAIPRGDTAVASNPDAGPAMSTAAFLVQVAATLLATLLIVQAGKKTKEEDYMGSFLTFLGGMLAGIAPKLAVAFFYY